MRAAATVVRLMPSPRNTITFFALTAIAPLPAARAAPARYHHAAVSPCGCVMAGTSMGAAVTGTVVLGAALRPVVVLAQAAIAPMARASGTTVRRIGWHRRREWRF